MAIVSCLAAPSSALIAQNSIQLFGPVNVRLSESVTTYSNPNIFNTATLNLACNASPITATLSSTADNTGNVLVDNNIFVTATANGTATARTNVCTGGTSTSAIQNCFTTCYEDLALSGTITGQDPDQYVSNGGVPPVSISSQLVPGSQQVKIDLQDEGVYLTSSTIYLNTNCTLEGVTGPATVAGNPISQSNPTPDQLSQDFSFDPITNQTIGFGYDLTQAQSAGTLTVVDGTIPQVGDQPLDPSTFQQVWTPGTSFATSNCLVHNGELLPSGQPACKLFTLECSTGTGATASGAQCPVSTVSNEIVEDDFDGPAFSLPEIHTPDGRTFHEGIGFLMASEGWTGGPCAFDPASGLQDLPCPQNLLISFTGPGSFENDGRTTHPNSTFISIAGVPEDRTTVKVKGEWPDHWINSRTARVNFVSQPPYLKGTRLPGANSFIPSPVQSITYGISAADSVPVPGEPIPGDVILVNPDGCPIPTAANPGPFVAPDFAPGERTLTFSEDGRYRLHFYAQDCAGTEELKFTQDASGSWSTGFYTREINVDTVPPAITGLALWPEPSAHGSYEVGQAVKASYACTDATSGVVLCGNRLYPPGATLNTGTLTTPVDTRSPGEKTFTVLAVDAAGNLSSASVSYMVTR
ncbi:MAG: hypothetical protein ABSE87_03905 [Terracidiphilus sp.]